MNKYSMITGFFVLILLQSCDYGILYDNPQPIGTYDLMSFPPSYIGKYKDDSNKATLIIEPARIIKISYNEFAFSKAEIDTMTDCRLAGDSLYVADLSRYLHISIMNDSVFGVLDSPDTLFTLSKNNILRKMKQNYFLSLIHKSGYWQVVRLREIKKGFIEFSVVPRKVNYDLLNSITRVKEYNFKEDSSNYYLVSPTQREFKKIVKEGLFNNSEFYRRQ